jgi:hypothetical protein
MLNQVEQEIHRQLVHHKVMQEDQVFVDQEILMVVEEVVPEV